MIGTGSKQAQPILPHNSTKLKKKYALVKSNVVVVHNESLMKKQKRVKWKTLFENSVCETEFSNNVFHVAVVFFIQVELAEPFCNHPTCHPIRKNSFDF